MTNTHTTMTGWDIETTPRDIEVADDRDRVAGYDLWAIDPETCEGTHIGAAIPPEGSSLDCWLALDRGIEMDDEQHAMIHSMCSTE